jgi:hypothetical protein
MYHLSLQWDIIASIAEYVGRTRGKEHDVCREDAQGGQQLVTDVVTLLLALPAFPPARSNDALITLCERAAHDYIRERKAAIEQAAEMLKRGEHREAVLAVLAYLARHDLMMGVREKAQEALDADAKRQITPSSVPQDSRHVFGVRCPNGHVSYFKKQIVCNANKQVPRSYIDSAGKPLEKLLLTCETCGVQVTALIDCSAY